MTSFRAAAILGLLCSISHPLFAETPTPVLEAIVQANRMLGKGHAGEAVKILEAHLTTANGDTAFNDTLRAAYTAEMKELTDPNAVAIVRRKLEAIGTALPLPVLPGEAAPETAKAPAVDLLKQATAIFNQANEPGQFITARDLFWKAFNNKVQMSAEQTSDWAYCRLKVAADRFNKSADAATANEVVKEVTEALASVPENKQLQELGSELLATAKQRAGASVVVPVSAVAEPATSAAIETDSFTLKFQGNKALAESIAKIVEAKRTEIFTRWSGPPGGKWNPKCEIVIHESAEAFAKATKLSAAATGRADATLAEGRVTARRIDLRADDTTLLENALPRELTHIILADLFPSQKPPRWAELGMAVLSSSNDEVSRYLRTMPRVANSQEWLSIPKLIGAAEVPAANVTAFHVESVSLVEFFVRWHGEKAFTAFLRDSQRYGVEPAFKRQYGLKDSHQLEIEWKKNVLGE
jgi:hypothetical protein